MRVDYTGKSGYCYASGVTVQATARLKTEPSFLGIPLLGGYAVLPALVVAGVGATIVVILVRRKGNPPPPPPPTDRRDEGRGNAN